ncbi:conserved hypothetical protein [uncultured Thiomicrorhabdus sp.]
MGKINVLGCDPAFKNFGMAHATVDTETLEVEILSLELIETEKDSAKTIRRSSDDLRRAQGLYLGFTRGAKEKSVIFSEIPSGTQSARASWALGIALGVLSASPTPLIQLSPNEVKLASAGKNASKAEMIDWAYKLHPNANWLTRKLKGKVVLVNKNEHLADAVAAIYAGIESEQFRQVIEMHRSLSKAG